METPVRITFDCLPLRSIGRLDVPIDASPEYRARCQKIKQAIETHGSHNSYFLLNGECVFQLTNEPTIGVVAFSFEGVALTDPLDSKTKQVDLAAELKAETSGGMSKPVADWFADAVRQAVAVEFDRYIASGDLAQAYQRLAKVQRECNDTGGYLGMYL